ncbi:MAG: class I SAM-dependent methyltransferase [Pseudomonadota bacterium]
MGELDAIFTLHSGLLREAPGSDASTLRALTATGVQGAVTVADMGCGPGASTLVLAQALPEARITAIDLHQPYLNALLRRADAAGLDAHIDTSRVDMGDPGFAPGSLDLIWCEGALYNLGVEEGLRLWRPFLRPGGRLAFTDAVWRADTPPEPARAFWLEYPAMTDAPGVIARAAAAGFRVTDHFFLPPEDWRAYLGPLGARAAALRPGADDTLRRVLDGAVEEAALFERYGDSYGYAFFIAEPA